MRASLASKDSLITMTKKLYLDDAYQTTFKARLLKTETCPQGFLVTCDQTCFYPDSGGQPSDHGKLAGAKVMDVVESGHDVVHIVASMPPGPQVEGVVDWTRRLDHMQQHSGQHILSQAFLQTIGANTVAFHLGKLSATIDVDKLDLDTATIHQVEDLCNQIIFENRKIRQQGRKFAG